MGKKNTRTAYQESYYDFCTLFLGYVIIDNERKEEKKMPKSELYSYLYRSLWEELSVNFKEVQITDEFIEENIDFSKLEDNYKDVFNNKDKRFYVHSK